MRLLLRLLAGCAVCLAATGAARAQSADGRCVLPDAPGDVTAFAIAIACINEKAEAAAFAVANQEDLIAALRQQIADARTAQSNLEMELMPFREAVGAVVAFDRSDKMAGGACPAGWSYFEAAGGRMIVGAGNRHENKDMNGNRLTRHAALQDDVTEGKKESTGGEETHLLTIAEMPSHDHPAQGFVGLDSERFGHGDAIFGPNATKTGLEGGSQPHNTMPPYVALYYCKRD